jgi:hypothetical protein
MFHVWQMTGGEPAGWGPVKDPFVLPVPATHEIEAEESDGRESDEEKTGEAGPDEEESTEEDQAGQ